MQTISSTGMFEKSFHPIQSFDPFASPPDIKNALKHRNANLLGFQNPQQSDQICPCCFKCSSKQQYDLRCSISDIRQLGEGIALYFKSVKIGIILYSILFVVFMVEWIIYHHLIRGQNAQIADLRILEMRLSLEVGYDIKFGLVGVAVYLFIVFFIKRYYDIELYILKKDRCQPEQYTLLFQGFPKSKTDQLKMWIEKQTGITPLTIHHIYDLREVKTFIANKQNQIIAENKRKLKALSNSINLENSLEEHLIHNKKSEEKNSGNRFENALSKYKSAKAFIQTGSVFVVFQTANEAYEIEQKYSHPSTFLCFGKSSIQPLRYQNKQILVKRACNPRDCVWENFHQNQRHFIVRIMIMAVGIIMCFLLLWGVVRLHKEAFQGTAWSGSCMGTLVAYFVFHLILHGIISAYLYFDDYRTYTQKQIISFYVYGYFNSLIACILPYSVSLPKVNFPQYINFILLLDAFVHPIIKVFNFNNIYRKLFAIYITNLQNKSNPYTQDYVNKLIEGRQFRLGENYHYIFRGLAVSTFYSHPTPYAFLYYILSSFIEYITLKYLLLRKCKVPPKYSSNLSSLFVRTLSLLPAIYVIGLYQYTQYFYPQSKQYRIPLILLLIVAKMLSILLIMYFKKRKGQLKPKKTYIQAEVDFDQYYELQNEIIKYNGELKELNTYFNNKFSFNITLPPMLDQTLDPLLDLQYKNSEVYSPECKNSRARLVKRLLSSSIQMSRFLGIKQEEASYQNY